MKLFEINMYNGEIYQSSIESLVVWLRVDRYYCRVPIRRQPIFYY